MEKIILLKIYIFMDALQMKGVEQKATKVSEKHFTGERLKHT
jgi:hypothetical protein